MPSKINMRSPAILLLAILSAALFSCANTRTMDTKTPIFKDRDSEVLLLGIAAEGYIPDGGAYSHPAVFKEDELKFLLVKLGHTNRLYRIPFHETRQRFHIHVPDPRLE